MKSEDTQTVQKSTAPWISDYSQLFCTVRTVVLYSSVQSEQLTVCQLFFNAAASTEGAKPQQLTGRLNSKTTLFNYYYF